MSFFVISFLICFYLGLLACGVCVGGVGLGMLLILYTLLLLSTFVTREGTPVAVFVVNSSAVTGGDLGGNGVRHN